MSLDSAYHKRFSFQIKCYGIHFPYLSPKVHSGKGEDGIPRGEKVEETRGSVQRGKINICLYLLPNHRSVISQKTFYMHYRVCSLVRCRYKFAETPLQCKLALICTSTFTHRGECHLGHTSPIQYMSPRYIGKGFKTKGCFLIVPMSKMCFPRFLHKLVSYFKCSSYSLDLGYSI